MSCETPICHCDTPMISTMAFSGAELWCWNCGNTEGMFNGLQRKELTQDEKVILDAKHEEASDFLYARGCIYGGGMKRIDGDIVPFNKFPKELQEKLQKNVDLWTYEKVGN